jgi:2-oxo-3-hexenedioate decarboxylase
MPMPAAAIQSVAREVFTLLGTGRQTSSFHARDTGFSIDEAYRVTPLVRQMREQLGQHPIGRKIGFTNRTIWPEYNVFAPIWGYMYDRTVFELADVGDGFSLNGLPEPRIEPEILFHFAEAPRPGMNEADLLGCIDWIAHGFEIVQSLYPGWKFAPADTIAAFGLHGAYLLGPRYEVGDRHEHWLSALADFDIELLRNGTPAARGHASHVLDGPLPALRHLNDLLARDPVNPPLAAGEIVTTGTLTAAMPVAAGERWETSFTGIEVAGIGVSFV